MVRETGVDGVAVAAGEGEPGASGGSLMNDGGEGEGAPAGIGDLQLLRQRRAVLSGGEAHILSTDAEGRRDEGGDGEGDGDLGGGGGGVGHGDGDGSLVSADGEVSGLDGDLEDRRKGSGGRGHG
jgi:hypothetical protein